jgi:hypothetical protein
MGPGLSSVRVVVNCVVKERIYEKGQGIALACASVNTR